MKLIRTSIGIALAGLIVLLASVNRVEASTFDSLTNTAFDTVDDAGYGETSYAIRFGSTLQQELKYDTVYSSFIFGGNLKVRGYLSGSSLRVDQNASIFGQLVASGSIITKSTLSGRLLVVSGNATFSGGAVFKNGLQVKGNAGISGATLRISGAADIHGPLSVSGALRGDGDFTINDDRTTSADAVLTFGNSTTNQTLKYIHVHQRFQFSTNLNVLGSISGSRLSISGNANITGALVAKSGVFNTGSGLVTTASVNIHGKGTNNYRALTFFSSTQTGTAKGGLMVGARKNNGHDPFAGFGMWDNGTNRIVYLGGGAWSTPDATDIRFFTNSYDETNGVLGNLRATVTNGGLEVFGTITGTTLNATSLLTGSTLQGFGLYNCQGTANKLTYNASTKKFLCESDQAGGTTGGTGGSNWSNTGSLQGAFDTRYLRLAGGTMTGTLNIERISGDIVKSTTGTTSATDFSKAGSTLSNVTSTNDALDMDNGTVPNGGLGTMASSSVVVGAAAGAGAHTIVRSDAKLVIIRGNAANSAYLWDGLTTTMSATATNPLSSGTVGAGAISLLKPDGRYIVIAGGGVTTTGIFDPFGAVATAAGPAVCSTGANTGTNAALIGSGTYLILCGNTTNWGILNAQANTYFAGAALGATFGAGAHAIALDDGRFLVFAGGNTSSHWIFNPRNMQQQPWGTINPLSSPPTITTGAFSYRRSDGMFVIVGGAQNASTIYNPRPNGSPNGSFTAQSVSAGFGPTVALADGAGAVWRQDGRMLLMIGGSATTNIIDPSRTDAGQFIAGPNIDITGGTPGAGAHMIMNARGTIQIIKGGSSTNTSTYDMGYIIGGNSTVTSSGSIYQTECISTTALHSGATLWWNGSSIDRYVRYLVRTGNGSCPSTETSYKPMLDKGLLIRPTPGDNRIQIKVLFGRGYPYAADQEWGLRRGLSQVSYRHIMRDPVLFDIRVDNSSMVHKTQFDFGGDGDTSGPMTVNISNNGNRNLQIQLAQTVAFTSTVNVNSGGGGTFMGAINGHAPLTTAASVGTIVMKKPDGTYVIISGGSAAANAQLLNTSAQSITALGTTPTAPTGTGAFAFKRPDGKFVIGMGRNTKTTNIYDPYANTFTAGPNLMDRVGEGSVVMPMPNGRVLILHGGFRRTSTIYDPYFNTTYTGAIIQANIGRGAMAIPRPNGQYLVVPGTSTQACATQTATFLFDPYSALFLTNAGTAFTTTGTGPGAVAIERADGKWMIFKGGATTNTCGTVTASQIYDPVLNVIAAGPIVTAQRYGSSAVQRPDGQWLIFNANALTTTQIYNENAGTFAAGSPIGAVYTGPASTTVIGSGSVALQLDNGKYFVTSGANAAGSAGTTTAMIGDFGWISEGFYRSEVMRVVDLDSTSTLTWRQSPASGGITAHVRTGTSALTLAKEPDRDVAYSGGPINPDTGDTFVQVNFAFKRTVPPTPGIMEDVWYNGGTAPPHRRRTFASPTITEYSIGKDSDLMNLKADETSLFRVNSNGDVYTGTKGALYSGGADLAERYLSRDELTPGELVTFDYTNDHSVRRSTKKYQSELLGVVSTNPGFVAGAYTKDSFPIALVGRVPVLVSLENGEITAGDRLTSSTLPGYAMRATKAGRVIGVSLESTRSDRTVPCEADRKKQCATVMMFVNLSDWPGPSSD